MPITKISTQGRAFVRLHEGNPLTAYLDPVGVPTIGTGFTMRSDSVRRELAKIGITKLVPGKTKITAAQSDAILDAVLAAEYVHGPTPVERRREGSSQDWPRCGNHGADDADFTRGYEAVRYSDISCRRCAAGFEGGGITKNPPTSRQAN